MPFSYAAVLASPAFQSIKQAEETVSGTDTRTPRIHTLASVAQAAAGQTRRGPVKVNLGDWTVDEIQICEMGSWGPEGEYVRAGGISLT